MTQKVRQLFAGIFIISMLAIPVMAQILGSVKGTITDKKSKAPLEKVKITIISTRASSIVYNLTTNAKGHFYRSGLKNGTYDVLYQKDDYIPMKSTIRLRIGETKDISLAIEPFQQKMSAPSNLLKQSVDLINSAEYDKALAKITQLFEKNPNNEVLFYYRAYIFDKKGEKEKALADYLKSIDLKPDFVLPLTSVGKLHAKQGKFAKAVEYYKKAYDLKLTDMESLYNYGVCLLNLGKSKEALVVFGKLIQIDPQYADGYYQLGLVYLGLGNNAKAKEALNKFLQLDPKNKDAEVAQEILKSL